MNRKRKRMNVLFASKQTFKYAVNPAENDLCPHTKTARRDCRTFRRKIVSRSVFGLFQVPFGVPMVGVVTFHFGKNFPAGAQEKAEQKRILDGDDERRLVIQPKSQGGAFQVLGADPENVIRDDERHEKARDERYPEILFLGTQVDDGNAQAANGHQLIGPAEVIPKDVESIGVQIAPKDERAANGENGNGQNQAVPCACLVQVEKFGDGETQAAERRVPARNRQNDDSDDDQNGNGGERDDGGNERTQNFDAARADKKFGHLLVNEHAARGPDHADKAFDYHHSVECLPSREFGFFRAGDERTLGAVETADDSASDGDEEHRDYRLVGGMLVEIARKIRKAYFVENVQVRGDSHENAEGR